MSRARVLFLNPSLHAVGGMQAWLAHLMPDLVAAGFEVGLALPTGAHNDAAAYLAAWPWQPTVLVENPTASRIGQLRGVERALERFRPDLLVVANIVAAYRAVEAMRARGGWAPRVAACVHTLDGGIFEDLRQLSHVIDALVAPNRLIAAAGRELSQLPPERIFHAPYRVDAAGEPPAAPRQRSGGEERRVRIVFAHRLDASQKRALELPALWAALRAEGVDAELDLAGDGPDAPRLRAAFAGEVAAGRVRFHGWIAPAEFRARLFSTSAIFLVLSEWEMGPMALWQAMAWGMPVVSTRYVGSGLEGVLVDGENCLLVPVGAPEAAARAVARLASDPDLARRLAGRAQLDVAARFSREVATGAWARAIEATLALPALPRPTAPPTIAPSGRLDRWLGLEGAERFRRLLRLRIPTRGPGDEWPHTGSRGLAHGELLARLAELDRAGEAGASAHLHR